MSNKHAEGHLTASGRVRIIGTAYTPLALAQWHHALAAHNHERDLKLAQELAERGNTWKLELLNEHHTAHMLASHHWLEVAASKRAPEDALKASQAAARVTDHTLADLVRQSGNIGWPGRPGELKGGVPDLSATFSGAEILAMGIPTALARAERQRKDADKIAAGKSQNRLLVDEVDGKIERRSVMEALKQLEDEGAPEGVRLRRLIGRTIKNAGVQISAKGVEPAARARVDGLVRELALRGSITRLSAGKGGGLASVAPRNPKPSLHQVLLHLRLRAVPAGGAPAVHAIMREGDPFRSHAQKVLVRGRANDIWAWLKSTGQHPKRPKGRRAPAAVSSTAVSSTAAARGKEPNELAEIRRSVLLGWIRDMTNKDASGTPLDGLRNHVRLLLQRAGLLGNDFAAKLSGELQLLEDSGVKRAQAVRRLAKRADVTTGTVGSILSGKIANPPLPRRAALFAELRRLRRMVPKPAALGAETYADVARLSDDELRAAHVRVFSTDSKAKRATLVRKLTLIAGIERPSRARCPSAQVSFRVPASAVAELNAKAKRFRTSRSAVARALLFAAQPMDVAAYCDRAMPDPGQVVAQLPGRPGQGPLAGWVASPAPVVVPGADGPVRLDASYRVVEAGKLIPSHVPSKGFERNRRYPMGGQERDYRKDRAEQLKVQRIAQRLDPGLLLATDPTATGGPPIVSCEGWVAGGNGRTMALQLAYGSALASADTYRRALVGAGAQFGVPAEQLEQMKQPVLVRVLARYPETPKRRLELSRLLNEGLTGSVDSRAQEASRSTRLTSSHLDDLKSGLEERTLRDWLTTQNGRRWLQVLERAGVVSPRPFDGDKPSDRAISEVEGALLARFVPVAMQDLLGSTMRGRLADAVPYLVAAAEEGDRWAAPLAELPEGIKIWSAVQATPGARTVEDLRRQASLVPVEYSDSPAASTWAAVLLERSGSRQIVTGARGYLAAAQHDRTQNLFGDRPEPVAALATAYGVTA